MIDLYDLKSVNPVSIPGQIYGIGYAMLHITTFFERPRRQLHDNSLLPIGPSLTFKVKDITNIIYRVDSLLSSGGLITAE